jgi:hypothetical protein
MQLSPEDDVLRKKAISYINSLQELILIQEGYSNIADSITIDKARVLDDKVLMQMRRVHLQSAEYLEGLKIFNSK